jgi:hypothetical protein
MDKITITLTRDHAQHIVNQYDECIANYGYMPGDIRDFVKALRYHLDGNQITTEAQ